jgi:drug/metabolite transporter (DMT)-like permease
LFLRGLAVMVIGLALLFVTGQIRFVPKLFDPVVLGRSGLEVASTLGYILGLTYAPIADLNALSQIAPVLLTLVAVVFLGARIGRLEVALIALAFVGALLVAQPGTSAFSSFTLFGIWTACCSVARDLLSRKVHDDIPGIVVAVGAGVAVMVGGAILMLLFEQFVVPDARSIIMMCAAAVFLTAAHLCVFLAFRYGEVTAVAPFIYASTIWALISGFVVFRTLPNALGFIGIGLILLCGVSVVLLEGRRSRLAVGVVN